MPIVIVGSYAPADRPGIHAVGVDAANGQLVRLAGWPGVENPSFVVVAPDRTGVYAVSEIGAAGDDAAGRVHAFALDTDGPEPELSPTNHRPSKGDDPCHLATDPEGRWLVVANYGSGSFTVLPTSPSGGLDDPTATVRHEGHGPHPERQTEPHAHGTAFTPDGRHLAMADLGADRVAVYEIDRSTGSIEHRCDADVAPGAGPRHLSFTPDGRLLVVANELDNTVATHRFDPATGRTTAIDNRSTLPGSGDAAPDNQVAAIRMSPTGDRLYVSNRGHDSIAVIGLDGDGRLAEPDHFPCGGHWPRDVVLLPDGRHMVVANERSNELALLPLSADGASIGAAVARLEIASPTCVAPVG